jgi:hypothetical protein
MPSGFSVRTSKGLSASGENQDTTGRTSSRFRFIDTAVIARGNSSSHAHTPPERCRSKFRR